MNVGGPYRSFGMEVSVNKGNSEDTETAMRKSEGVQYRRGRVTKFRSFAYYEGLSSSEIAVRESMPIGTVKSRTAAALATLRSGLGG